MAPVMPAMDQTTTNVLDVQTTCNSLETLVVVVKELISIKTPDLVCHAITHATVAQEHQTLTVSRVTTMLLFSLTLLVHVTTATTETLIHVKVVTLVAPVAMVETTTNAHLAEATPSSMETTIVSVTMVTIKMESPEIVIDATIHVQHVMDLTTTTARPVVLEQH